MAALRPLLPTKLCHRHHLFRTFIDARVKWVGDPYLDTAILKEKHLKPLISLKNLICSYPSKSLPLSTASALKTHLSLPTTTLSFCLRYPSVFTIFQPGHGLPLHIKLTAQALGVHYEESAIDSTPSHRLDAVNRLAKLLMLTRNHKLPVDIIDRLKWDLGLPRDYVTLLLSDYPDYFDVRCVRDELSGKDLLCLELVCWREELAVPELVRRERERGRRGSRISYSMNFPRGFQLEKRIQDWVDQWQVISFFYT